jgi:hypothetical protein
MITALYAHLEEISLQKQLEDWVDELREVRQIGTGRGKCPDLEYRYKHL